MNLYLLRHAIAVERGTEGYTNDSDRPLTPDGTKKMKRIAAGMKAMGLSFDVILSSPILRAKQTAVIASKALGLSKTLQYLNALSTAGDPQEAVETVRKDYSDYNDILLVGHEPDMSIIISVLISGSESLDITMKKGGLCKLVVGSLAYEQCARLEWLLAPKQLVTLR